ncbi:YfhO family protein [Streptococcus hongkongensis]|nr:copper ABC transporter permease [Streptococcus uberis]
MTAKKICQSIIYHSISFLIPLIIMFFVLYSKDIYYSGPKTILASDGFHQYVIFAQNLRNILHGKDSIFYTFTSGLGLNFYALMSYYLGSFLSPFYYFFTLTTMPDAVYLFTLLKFGLIGLSSYYAFHRIYPKVHEFFILSLSISFSLMSFLTSQFEINTWLDVFILVPLVLLGLNQLIKESKFFLYYACLATLFFQNYYFGYMLSLFLLLYTIVLLIEIDSWKSRLHSAFNFINLSIFAALTSAIMILPAVKDLSSHGEKLTPVLKIFTENTSFWDLLAKNIIGTYDTTKFNSIPMLYSSLFPLLLTILYFTLSNVKWQSKIAHATLLLIILISYYIQPLDLFWQGMHAPNMFLHRYSWTFSLILVLISGKTLTNYNNIKPITIGSMFTILSVLLCLPYFLTSKFEFLTLPLLLLTLAFLTAYTLLLVSHKETKLPILYLTIFTLFFTVMEISVNSYYIVSGLEKEWGFPLRDGYQKNLKEIDSLVKETQTKSDEFFRTERMLPQTGNDSMKFNYNGISQFSSIRNTASSKVLDRLGYKSTGTNLNLRYQNNTIIMDSLMGVKYNLSPAPIDKNGFHKIKENGHTSLYQNDLALGLGILTDTPFKTHSFTVNTLDNQKFLLNQLSGLQLNYFKEIPYQTTNFETHLDKRITAKADNSSLDTIVSYQLTVPSHSQLYLSVPNINFSNDNSKRVVIKANNHSQEFSTDNSFTFFDLGNYQKNKTITIDLIFPKNKTISYDSPHFYHLDTTAYHAAIKTLKDRDIYTTTKKNKVYSYYSSKTNGSIFYTIPYDRGWSAEINGKKANLRKAQNGFMVLDIKKGKGKVKLTFIPNGFKIGIIMSLLGIILFMLYSFFHTICIRKALSK